MGATRVGIVVLGDEVLKGEVREANIAHMIPLLNGWGAKVVLCAVLPDDIPTVVRHLKMYREEADLLILTGGIGPTPDDITREAVAQAAGVPVVLHPEAKEILERYYRERGIPGGMNEYRLLMAHVPEGAELIPNPRSGAPGFFIAGMAAFPGVPSLLQGMFGWVRERISGKPQAKVILYSMAPESAFAGIMQEAMDAFPDVGVGSYPEMEGKYRVRVVFRADRHERAADAADRFAGRLAEAGWAVDRRVEEPGA